MISLRNEVRTKSRQVNNGLRNLPWHSCNVTAALAMLGSKNSDLPQAARDIGRDGESLSIRRCARRALSALRKAGGREWRCTEVARKRECYPEALGFFPYHMCHTSNFKPHLERTEDSNDGSPILHSFIHSETAHADCLVRVDTLVLCPLALSLRNGSRRPLSIRSE